MTSWKSDLIRAARHSNLKFESGELVSNEAHARVVMALLAAFGHDPAGLLLAEPRTPDRQSIENARPTDALLLKPTLGAFLVEVKGWTLDRISHVEAGTIFHRAAGFEEAHNPWKQAQEASAQIQRATQRILQRRRIQQYEIPYFDWIVAFPNIAKASWLERGFGLSIAGCEVLFQQDLAAPTALRHRLESYIAGKAGARIPCSVEQLSHVREALGSSLVISRRAHRSVPAFSSKLGQVVDANELKDKRLSAEQMSLIEAEFDGRPQLIRGVAGSGKSVVLVRNLANLIDRELQDQQLFSDPAKAAKRFAIVCFNRSLVPFLRRAFEDAYRELTYSDPPSCVDIFHLNGLQWKLSSHFGGPLEYQRYREASHSPDPQSYFAARYSAQLDSLAKSNESFLDRFLYDSIYVDEGQDFFDEEYLFLMRLLRVSPQTTSKNIVIFYDDAQNIYGRPRPTWSELGIQVTGGRTRVMKTCFRNTKPIVEFAFNLLLGSGAATRVATRTFADVGYLKENNLIEELSDRWQVNFADRSEGIAPGVHLFKTREEAAL